MSNRVLTYDTTKSLNSCLSTAAGVKAKPPTKSRVERIIRAGSAPVMAFFVHCLLCHQFAVKMDAVLKKYWKDEQPLAQQSDFILKSDPGRTSLESILKEAEEIYSPSGSLGSPSNLVRQDPLSAQHYRHASAEPPRRTQINHPDPIVYSGCCLLLAKEIRVPIELLVQIIHRDSNAERRVGKERK